MTAPTPFLALTHKLDHLHDVAPVLIAVDMAAWSPDAVEANVPAGLSEVAEQAYRDVLFALRTLEATVPLVDDGANGVRETLRLHGKLGHRKADAMMVRPGSTGHRTTLELRNVIGRMESVTSWGMEEGKDGKLANWCASRSLGDDLGDAWDISRRERRVVDYYGKLHTIDPGVLLILDAMVAMGCETHHSCEGHPTGGYVIYQGEGRDAATEVFQSCGWEAAPSTGGLYARLSDSKLVPMPDRMMARMPKSVATVDQRNQLLRATSLEFLRHAPSVVPGERTLAADGIPTT